jgi:hypothetical protein
LLAVCSGGRADSKEGDDEAKWQPFPPAVSARIESAYQLGGGGGGAGVRVKVARREYIVHVDRMTQVGKSAHLPHRALLFPRSLLLLLAAAAAAAAAGAAGADSTFAAVA